MRWPRILRRRPKGPPWVGTPLTFRTETREVATHDGPMTVRVPVLNDPRRDLRRVQCNYAVATSTCAAGARAYVVLLNPGNGSNRICILARSRGGRMVSKWEDIRKLKDFRAKTVPPEHPAYGLLEHVGYGDPEATAEELECARIYWKAQRADA